MSSPLSRFGDSTTWKGPRTVLSVPPLRSLTVSTSIETPSTSERRMNSWRVGSHFWPTAVRKSIAYSHSWRVGRTSRM